MKRRKQYLIITIYFLFANIVSVNQMYAQQSYKSTTGYLLQKVEPLTYSFYIPFKLGLVLPYFYGYYVVNDETLHNFLEIDSVDYNQAIMLFDPATETYADSSIAKKVGQYTRIKDILLLDDSEIYEIGNGEYIIRKIRYSYYDNSQVKIYIKGYNHYMWDDITSDDMVEFYATYEVGQLYNREYYQCYHHLIEILQTPPDIQNYSWKKLFQIGTE